MINQFNNWLDNNDAWKIIIILSIVFVLMTTVVIFGQYKFVTMSIVVMLCVLTVLRLRHHQ